jgi:hypothetical protein
MCLEGTISCGAKEGARVSGRWGSALSVHEPIPDRVKHP